MNDDLAGRVLAAIDETLRIVETIREGGCPVPTWTMEPSRSQSWHILREVDDQTPIGFVTDGRWEVRHIVHNDPAATIRRCEADKRTVERHNQVDHSVPFADYQFDYCATCRELMPCPDMLDRAASYGVDVTAPAG
jgi:hypothetical protein